jgi:hypothetical protein
VLQDLTARRDTEKFMEQGGFVHVSGKTSDGCGCSLMFEPHQRPIVLYGSFIRLSLF